MTANASNDDRQACLDAGMDDFLTKPIRPEQLYRALGRWIGRGAGMVDASDEPAAREGNRPPTPAVGSGEVDPAAFERLGLGDPQKSRRFAEAFLKSVGDAIEECDRGLAKSDLALLREVGHRIKSTARWVEAESLARACEALERAYRWRSGRCAGAGGRIARPPARCDGPGAGDAAGHRHGRPWLTPKPADGHSFRRRSPFAGRPADGRGQAGAGASAWRSRRLVGRRHGRRCCESRWRLVGRRD